jgi:hypothetical protein
LEFHDVELRFESYILNWLQPECLEMPKTTVSDKHRATSKNRSAVKSVIGKSNSGNRELWRVSSSGEVRTVVTSVASVQAMDQAVKVLGPALRRLANR